MRQAVYGQLLENNCGPFLADPSTQHDSKDNDNKGGRRRCAESRREVERLFAALPPSFSAPIEEFVLSTFERGAEVFEYITVVGRRRVEFCMQVKDKTAETTERALQEFVLGLARMQAGSKFWRPLDRSERREYDSFIAEWLPVCRRALGAKVP